MFKRYFVALISNFSRHYILSELTFTSRYSSTCSTRIAGSYTDPRYELVGKVREDRLFEDNGVSYVTRNLPRYPAADERHYYWNLYVNRYFEWDPDCDSEYGLNREDFITTVEYSVDISWSLGITLLFSIVFFIVCGILLCVYNVILNQDPGDDSCSLKNVDVGALVIKGVLILIIIWYCYSNIGVISSYNQTVDVLAQGKCSDLFTNKIFLSYNKDLYSSSGKNYLALIMSLIILATCLIYSCMVNLPCSLGVYWKVRRGLRSRTCCIYETCR
ncbi:unnamed protein product [Moneuplotes crassus]|uniref:Uncharacterized protein n=1 Tax=Euplotes crassus TaxID=5936 RepID=A0AAD1X6Z9_EUPCR|nr:unnamed protein product [Moneuplotes crassus]